MSATRLGRAGDRRLRVHRAAACLRGPRARAHRRQVVRFRALPACACKCAVLMGRSLDTLSHAPTSCDQHESVQDNRELRAARLGRAGDLRLRVHHAAACLRGPRARAPSSGCSRVADRALPACACKCAVLMGRSLDMLSHAPTCCDQYESVQDNRKSRAARLGRAGDRRLRVHRAAACLRGPRARAPSSGRSRVADRALPACACKCAVLTGRSLDMLSHVPTSCDQHESV